MKRVHRKTQAQIESGWTENQLRYARTLRRSIHRSPLWRAVFANDRPAYEAMLNQRYGVTSSTELTIGELQDLGAYMRGEAPKKYKRKRKPERTGTRSGAKVTGMVTNAQKNKIAQLEKIIEWKMENGFMRWCANRGGYPKTDAGAWKLIEAMKAMFERQMARTYGDGWRTRRDIPFAARRYLELHRQEKK